jgi:aminomethyltransferase
VPGARRRKEGGFVGSSVILGQLHNKSETKKRVGLLVEGVPARAGCAIHGTDGAPIGQVTSGGPAPSLQKNVAMGYVPPTHAKIGTPLKVSVRGALVNATVAKMPFVPHTYYRLK